MLRPWWSGLVGGERDECEAVVDLCFGVCCVVNLRRAL